MGRGRERAKQKPAGRSSVLGPRREAVDWGDPRWEDDPDDEAGSAGVREPRRPRPTPLSAAGALPEPEPPTYLKLADARR